LTLKDIRQKDFGKRLRFKVEWQVNATRIQFQQKGVLRKKALCEFNAQVLGRFAL
jgi:hypothetical protein